MLVYQRVDLFPPFLRGPAHVTDGAHRLGHRPAALGRARFGLADAAGLRGRRRGGVDAQRGADAGGNDGGKIGKKPGGTHGKMLTNDVFMEETWEKHGKNKPWEHDGTLTFCGNTYFMGKK